MSSSYERPAFWRVPRYESKTFFIPRRKKVHFIDEVSFDILLNLYFFNLLKEIVAN